MSGPRQQTSKHAMADGAGTLCREAWVVGQGSVPEDPEPVFPQNPETCPSVCRWQ